MKCELLKYIRENFIFKKSIIEEEYPIKMIYHGDNFLEGISKRDCLIKYLERYHIHEFITISLRKYDRDKKVKISNFKNSNNFITI